MKISVIVPIFNEEDNVFALVKKLDHCLPKLALDYEVIFVNDGSVDLSEKNLNLAIENNKKYKLINLRRNFGQTAAMMAGFEFASGDIVIPMDGDLQNDPEDIGNLIYKINEGFDVVSGWRKNRQDHIKRKIPSWIANSIISIVSGVKLHDYGCSLKAYRSSCIKNIRLYGEMHRFIPIYAHWQGAKVTEIVVNHHARIHGVSKYGMERIFKVLLDLVLIKFFAKFSTKPIYMFGGFGIILFLVALSFFLWAILLKLFYGISFIKTPLLMLSIILSVTGVMSILMGLLAEIVMRTYYESQDKSIYMVKSKINF
jgi:glycosyltransferase involved in cell wall biosynthesis